MEGYGTNRHASAPASPTKSLPSGNIFRSANDTLRDIFTPPTSPNTTPSVSPRKRARGDYTHSITNQDDDSDVDMNPESEGDSVTIIVGSDARPSKPLPRSRKALMGALSRAAEDPFVSTNKPVHHDFVGGLTEKNLPVNEDYDSSDQSVSDSMVL